MCGVIGYIGQHAANQLLYDGLVILQHRGQDAAGIMTSEGNNILLHKDNGLVRDVFSQQIMETLVGNSGIGHVRYPTAGGYNASESQPFFVNYFSGIGLVHNGNLTNAHALREHIQNNTVFEIKTTSDSELILLIFVEALLKNNPKKLLTQQRILSAVAATQERCQGAFSVIVLLVGHGVLAFKDRHGIRPLAYGVRKVNGCPEYMIASESTALAMQEFAYIKEMNAGEIIFISDNLQLVVKQSLFTQLPTPCIFEYVYLSRPDSVFYNVSVFSARQAMGHYLAKEIVKQLGRYHKIDLVVPIPDTSRIAALAVANDLHIPYSEAMVKNRYIGRTFIMPGQEQRKKSVRQKLNAISSELNGKTVLLVDDSIVRGTTSTEIIKLVKEAGAATIYFASACPPIRYPNVYGIDMASESSLIARHYNDKEIAQIIGADAVVFLELNDLKASVQQFNKTLVNFETSIFTGQYVTQDINQTYLQALADARA